MTNDSYWLAVGNAVKADVPGRSVPLADRARAVVARMRALGRLSSGAGLAGGMRTIYLATPHNGEPAGVARNRIGVLVPRNTPEITRRAVGRMAFTSPRIVVSPRPRAPIVEVAGMAVGAKAPGVRGLRFAAPRLAPFSFAGSKPRGYATRSSPGGKAGSVIVHRSATQIGPRMTMLVSRSETTRHGSSFPAPGMSARLGRYPAVSSLQRADAPGFHRTVKQVRAAAPAGDVYLDKAVVGYHLAAAITAEQTRAAARPNISGSGFNSSMAALRPSGAGL